MYEVIQTAQDDGALGFEQKSFTLRRWWPFDTRNSGPNPNAPKPVPQPDTSDKYWPFDERRSSPQVQSSIDSHDDSVFILDDLIWSFFSPEDNVQISTDFENDNEL